MPAHYDHYCWMFGEHKSDPCACGWATDKTKASAIRQYLRREMENVNRQQRETSPDNTRFIRYLQGMHDAFNRVVMFLDCHDKRND